MKSKPNTKKVKMQAGTGPDNIHDCRTPCLGAFVIIPMMVHAKSSRCRIYAVRKAASCDMSSCTKEPNPFHVPEPCYRELNQCEPQPKSLCSGRFEPAGLCPTARKFLLGRSASSKASNLIKTPCQDRAQVIVTVECSVLWFVHSTDLPCMLHQW